MVKTILAMLFSIGLLVGCDTVATSQTSSDDTPVKAGSPSTAPATRPIEKVVKSEAEWKKILTEAQYHILREDGTDPPFRNELNDNKKPGYYLCAGCDLVLFSSEHKYDSRTGWPSFWRPLHDHHVIVETESKLGFPRDEVICARCDGHQGHVFDDGPEPTGLRYCINSNSLKFVPKEP